MESWDIDRLLELSGNLVVQHVPLSQLREYEEVYWFDQDFPPTCRAVVEHARRIENVDLSYPIILSQSGLVMDGMHRVAKAHLLGHETIPTVRFDQDPEPDRIRTRNSSGAVSRPWR